MPAPRKISDEQLEEMLAWMELHPQLARTSLVGYAQDKAASYKLWEELASRLNCCGSGTTKTVKEWRMYWSDLKCRSRSRLTKQRQDAKAPRPQEDMPELIIKVLNVIGEKAEHNEQKQAVYGDNEHRIPVLKFQPKVADSAPVQPEHITEEVVIFDLLELPVPVSPEPEIKAKIDVFTQQVPERHQTEVENSANRPSRALPVFPCRLKRRSDSVANEVKNSASQPSRSMPDCPLRLKRRSGSLANDFLEIPVPVSPEPEIKAEIDVITQQVPERHQTEVKNSANQPSRSVPDCTLRLKRRSGSLANGASARVDPEWNWLEIERSRVEAENKMADASLIMAEAVKNIAEVSVMNAETNRMNAETNRANAETNSMNAETNRLQLQLLNNMMEVMRQLSSDV